MKFALLGARISIQDMLGPLVLQETLEGYLVDAGDFFPLAETVDGRGVGPKGFGQLPLPALAAVEFYCEIGEVYRVHFFHSNRSSRT